MKEEAVVNVFEVFFVLKNIFCSKMKDA